MLRYLWLVLFKTTDMFCFPNEETQKIYDEHKILKVLSHLFMTVRLKFIVTADKAYDLGEEEMREVLLK